MGFIAPSIKPKQLSNALPLNLSHGHSFQEVEGSAVYCSTELLCDCALLIECIDHEVGNYYIFTYKPKPVMEQTAPSMSILNVIFRALRRRPLPIPPSSRPRRRRILWSLIKKPRRRRKRGRSAT